MNGGSSTTSIPGRVAVDEEQGRQALAALDRVRHHDVHGGDVAVGDEPLLAVDHPASVAALGRRLDPRRVRAGVGLGDRVGVVELPAQRRLQVALDLLRRPAREHVVGARNVPRERVRRAAELLLDEEPLELRPALAAVLASVQAAAQPGLDRLALDPLPSSSGICPPLRSASSSFGISTSSTKRRARSRRSRCSPVRSRLVVGLDDQAAGVGRSSCSFA